jgi:hypothetical protein
MASWDGDRKPMNSCFPAGIAEGVKTKATLTQASAGPPARSLGTVQGPGNYPG